MVHRTTNMKNGQNTDLNNPEKPEKPEKGQERTNFYVQEYRDIT